MADRTLTERLELRLTPGQKSAVTAAAERRGWSTGEWLRRLIDRGLAGEAQR